MKLETVRLFGFSGFYHSIWIDDYIDFDYDFVAYTNDLAKEIFLHVKPYIDELLNGTATAEYSHLWSPKFYNFDTDEIYFDLEVHDEKGLINTLIVLIEEHYTQLEEIIIKTFTSRDGFLYFVDSDLEDWVLKLKSGILDPIQVGFLIGFFIMKEVSEIEWYNAVSERVSVYDYIIEITK